MADKEKNPSDSSSEKRPLKEGYQPSEKGYQPGTSNLDSKKPPQGGSGVPPKKSDDKGKGKQ